MKFQIAVAESKAAKAKDEIQRIAAIYRNEIIHMKAAKVTFVAFYVNYTHYTERFSNFSEFE